MPRVMKRDSYNKLKAEVKKTLSSGRRAINQIKVRMYWLTGRAIAKHIRLNGGSAGYGQKVIQRLSEDIQTNETHLYSSLEFYRAYPKFPPVGKLSWTHHRLLLSVNDPAKRKRISLKAAKEKWSKRELESALKKVVTTKPKRKPRNRLIPKKGKVGVFRIVAWEGGQAYDLGFSNYQVIRRLTKKQKAIQAKLNPKDLYTYKATLERIVDADTLWVKVKLKGNFQTRQKLRLRGINAPELKTKPGIRAKAFLVKYLKNQTHVIINTSKSDKYDRYLADIFTAKTYLNQLLIDTHHAQLV